MAPETGFRYGQAVEVHFARSDWPGYKSSGGVVRADEQGITIRYHHETDERFYAWQDLAYVIRYDNDYRWAEEESKSKPAAHLTDDSQPE